MTMSFFRECERSSNPPFASFFTRISSSFYQSTFLIRYFCDYQMTFLDKSPSSSPTAAFLGHRPTSHICLHSDTILWPNTMPACKSKAAKDEEVEDEAKAKKTCAKPIEWEKNKAWMRLAIDHLIANPKFWIKFSVTRLPKPSSRNAPRFKVVGENLFYMGNLWRRPLLLRSQRSLRKSTKHVLSIPVILKGIFGMLIEQCGRDEIFSLWSLSCT